MENRLENISVRLDEIPLLPTQKAFLEGQFIALNHFVLSKRLFVEKDFDADSLSFVLEKLLQHYDSLRVKFQRVDENWQARRLPFNKESLSSILFQIDLDEIDESERSECIDYFCSQVQEGMNIWTGDLVKIVYFKSAEESQLFIAIHHLVFDELSWPILLSDFEKIYREYKDGSSIFLEKTSVQLSNKISDLSNPWELLEQKKYWCDSLSDPWLGSLPFDFDDCESNANKDTRSVSVKWSSEVTDLLLNHSHQTYRTELRELLLSALVRSIESIKGEASVRVSITEDSRSLLKDGHASFGWHAYSYPITIRTHKQLGWSELIKNVKEQCRKVPEGIGYGMLRYLKEDADLIALTQNTDCWIGFDFQEKEIPAFVPNEKSLFKGQVKNSLYENPEALRKHLIEFKGRIENGKLQFYIEFNELQYQQTIEKLAHSFKKAVEKIVLCCQQPGAYRFTPSDFPATSLSQFEIEDLEFRFSNIQDIYPASEVQQAELTTYYSQNPPKINQLKVFFEGQPDLLLWKKSWALLSNKFKIFRTIFVGEELSGLNQVVLSEVPLLWSFLDWKTKIIQDSQEELNKYIEAQAADIYLDKAPLMNFHTIQFAEGKHCFLWNFHPLLANQSISTVWLQVVNNYKILLSDRQEGITDPDKLFIQEIENAVLDINKASPASDAPKNTSVSVKGFSSPKELFSTELIQNAPREVRVRGFKVKLEKIEAQILKAEGVEKAHVITEPDSGKIVAYLLLKNEVDEEHFLKQLNESLSASLPSYMLPQSYSFIGNIPVDGREQHSGGSSGADETYEGPRDEMEKIIQEIWLEVLGIDKVGIYDTFFSLGGDSLKVTRVLSSLKDEGFNISILDLFESKNIAEIAEKIKANGNMIKVNMDKEVKGIGSLLPFHLFYFSHVGNKAWNVSDILYFENPLNEVILNQAVEYAYLYHDALRINFKGDIHLGVNQIKMVNYGENEIQANFVLNDWSNIDSAVFEEKVKRSITELEENNIYSNKNLAHFVLYRSSHGDHFFILLSHLISDGVSLGILKEDIFDWYHILLSGRAISHKRKTDSFLLATNRVRKYAVSDRLLEEVPAWYEVISSFKNNLLIPRDKVIDAKDNIAKYLAVYSEVLLTGELKRIEHDCLQFKISLLDLILMAFGRAIKDWAGINNLGVFFISAGRQLDDLDLGRTVGCFAYGKHMKIDFSPEKDLIQNALMHRANIDKMANDGMGSNLILQADFYRGKDFEFAKHIDLNELVFLEGPSITVNYFDRRGLGQQEDKTTHSKSLFSKKLLEVDGEVKNVSLFALVIEHTDNFVSLSWEYNRLEFDEITIKSMVFNMKKSLLDLIAKPI